VTGADVVVVGAGAAGLLCAGIAGQLGLKVILIDHSARLAEKIRISGGGRCNFTNRDTSAANFLSANPHFCRSALARYTPQDFIALLQRHRVPFHEKHKGQLFCDDSSEDIIAVLLRECEAGSVQRWQPCSVAAVRQAGTGFELDTDRGGLRCRRLVVATGGLSIPKIGATDFGYRLARQFGHRIVDTRPALVPLTFAAEAWQAFVPLAGLSLAAAVSTGAGRSAGAFLEDLLFTHRGLSGPAILQISSYWQPGSPIRIDLAPDQNLAQQLIGTKSRSRKNLVNALAEALPRRLADSWLDASASAGRWPPGEQPLADCRDRDLLRLGDSLQRWDLVPSGTEGYRKAEVTAGGVDTTGLESSTLESRHQAGLYFIGEVVDVTGWLGGYNFQWAWASAAACARAMAQAGERTD
jgi:predicted Rossmann fold flavoprotein